MESDQLDEAIKFYERALQLRPNYAEALCALGAALKTSNRLDEAIAHYEQALAIRPNYVQAYFNRGSALREAGRQPEAIASYQRVLELQADHADAHCNLGAFQDQGSLVEAVASYDRALELEPDHAKAHNNRAMTRLLRGEFEEGWEEYEWRWKASKLTPREFSQPLWSGDSLKTQTIFVHSEQGLGDTIQFVRYLPLVKERCGKVVFECQKSLKKLLQ